MKYVVDRVEDDVVVLHELDGEKIINVDKKELDFVVKDGYVLVYIDDKYELDEDEYNKRKEKIASKFLKLKKKKDTKKHA